MTHQKSPRTADEQDQPEPERPTTPQEDAGMDLQQMEQPPQAEGQREVADEQVGDPARNRNESRDR
jgi:hypothetical protein